MKYNEDEPLFRSRGVPNPSASFLFQMGVPLVDIYEVVDG
jgi:hypothetical protein